MSSSSIGGYTMITVRGTPQPAGMVLADITRANVDGHAYQEQGYHAAPEFLTSIVDLTTAAGVKTEIEGYKALQATLVTIVDDLGNSWTNVAILSVRTSGGKYVACPVGGVNGGNYLLSAQWQVQHTEVPA